MREETRKKLRDVLGVVYTHTDRIINIVEAFMLADRSETVQAVAMATASALPALPSKWARVNALGHTEYIGPVEPLPRGGIRVRHTYDDDGDVGERVVDVYALHSVEYWDEERWQAERAELERVAKQRAQWRRQGHPEYIDDEGDEDGTDGHDQACTCNECVDDGDIPSDAAAGAPAAEDVERLDRSKPPPGYEVDLHTEDDGHDWYFTDEPYPGDDIVTPEWNDAHIHGGYGTQAAALEAAWTHYQERRDPLGLQTFESDPGAWWYFCAESEGRSRGEAFESQAAVRAAAWAHYWRRVELYERLCMVTFSGLKKPIWPRILTWSDAQVAEVGRWLAEGGEMPEALRG